MRVYDFNIRFDTKQHIVLRGISHNGFIPMNTYTAEQVSYLMPFAYDADAQRIAYDKMVMRLHKKGFAI